MSNYIDEYTDKILDLVDEFGLSYTHIEPILARIILHAVRDKDIQKEAWEVLGEITLNEMGF